MRTFLGVARSAAAALAIATGTGEAGAQPPPPTPTANPAAPQAAGAPQPPPPSQSAPSEQPPGTAPSGVAPTTEPIPPATLKIAGAAGIVFHPILPAAAADFELVMAKFFEAVAAVGDATQKSWVAGWKVVKAAEGAPGGVNALYLFVIDPVVADADYSGTFILEMIYKAFPVDAPDLHRRFAAAYAGPRHVLTLTPLLPALAPPTVVPAAPK